MNVATNIVRLLGAAQLFVFVGTLLSERLLASAVGSGSISDILVHVSQNPTRMRTSSLIALATSLAVVVLGALFYAVFHQQYGAIALVALGCYLAEAIVLAVSKIGAYALIPLSQEFIEAGAPEASRFQTLGRFFYYGLDRQGYQVVMLFFCLGAILWYCLLYASRAIPRALSAWGLAAVGLISIPVVLALYDRDFRTRPVMLLGAPYAPFELVLGLWLIIKGFS